MSLASFSKTRWKIEPDRVLIYPFRSFHIMTIVLGVLFIFITAVYIIYQNASFTDAIPILLFELLTLGLFWAFANTFIEFDNRNARMRKMLMGFLPAVTLSFKSLQGINPVSNMAGGYNYRLFRKNARYGKGTVVSSGYRKNDDPNAVAFVNEAVTVIHGYLNQHDIQVDDTPERITKYQFFQEQNGVYNIKTKKTGAIIFGLFFWGLAYWLFTIPAQNVVTILAMIAFMFFLGLVFINAAFTRFSFDPEQQIIQRKGLFPFLKKQYSFNEFRGVQTVRRSVNFIYAGTDINMHFDTGRKNGKLDVLTVSSFRRSKNIERFLQELYQVMQVA